MRKQKVKCECATIAPREKLIAAFDELISEAPGKVIDSLITSLDNLPPDVSLHDPKLAIALLADICGFIRQEKDFRTATVILGASI